MVTFLKKLVLASAMAAAATLPASAETYVAIIFTTPSLHYFKSPDDYAVNSRYMETVIGMHVCAANKLIRYRDTKLVQIFLPDGQVGYMDYADAWGGYNHDSANDKKCQAHAAQYAQQSNPRYAQVFSPAAQSASAHHAAAIGNGSVGGALAEATALEERRNWIGASDLLRPLAEQGNAQAQLAMGILGRKCACLPGWPRITGPSAREWFEKAAAQGNVQAETELGNLYRDFRTYPAAVSWYQKAADQGDAEAAYNLGLMYDEGQGVERNESLARKWLSKAVAGGNSDARQRLALVEQESSGIFSLRNLRTIVDAYNDNRPKFERIYKEHPFGFDGFIYGKQAMNDPSQGYFVTFNIGKDPNALVSPLLFGLVIECVNINDETTIDRLNEWIEATPAPRVKVLGTIADAEGGGLRLYNCTMKR